jgi:hypothetical protein
MEQVAAGKSTGVDKHGIKLLSFSPTRVFTRMHSEMELREDLDAFYMEHRRCGALELETPRRSRPGLS